MGGVGWTVVLREEVVRALEAGGRVEVVVLVVATAAAMEVARVVVAMVAVVMVAQAALGEEGLATGEGVVWDQVKAVAARRVAVGLVEARVEARVAG